MKPKTLVGALSSKLWYRSTFLQLCHGHYVMAIMSWTSDGVKLVNPVADIIRYSSGKIYFRFFPLLPEVEDCQEQLSWLESEDVRWFVHWWLESVLIFHKKRYTCTCMLRKLQIQTLANSLAYDYYFSGWHSCVVGLNVHAVGKHFLLYTYVLYSNS